MIVSSRERVFEYIRKKETATANEISQALRMSSANARHHLLELSKFDLVQVVGKKTKGKGRPEKIYRLSDKILGEGLSELSSALLEKYVTKSPGIKDDQEIQEIARGFAFQTNGSTTARLMEAIKALNIRHYHAKWEAKSEGPEIIFNHCPFASIVNKHPELCIMDKYILKFSLEKEIEIQGIQIRSEHGLPQCKFHVRS